MLERTISIGTVIRNSALDTLQDMYSMETALDGVVHALITTPVDRDELWAHIEDMRHLVDETKDRTMAVANVAQMTVPAEG